MPLITLIFIFFIIFALVLSFLNYKIMIYSIERNALKNDTKFQKFINWIHVFIYPISSLLFLVFYFDLKHLGNIDYNYIITNKHTLINKSFNIFIYAFLFFIIITCIYLLLPYIGKKFFSQSRFTSQVMAISKKERIITVITIFMNVFLFSNMIFINSLYFSIYYVMP